MLVDSGRCWHRLHGKVGHVGVTNGTLYWSGFGQSGCFWIRWLPCELVDGFMWEYGAGNTTVIVKAEVKKVFISPMTCAVLDVSNMMRTLHVPRRIFTLGLSRLFIPLLTSSWRLSSGEFILPMGWLKSTARSVVMVIVLVCVFECEFALNLKIALMKNVIEKITHFVRLSY